MTARQDRIVTLLRDRCGVTQIALPPKSRFEHFTSVGPVTRPLHKACPNRVWGIASPVTQERDTTMTLRRSHGSVTSRLRVRVLFTSL
jgi:hypothetical protein